MDNKNADESDWRTKFWPHTIQQEFEKAKMSPEELDNIIRENLRWELLYQKSIDDENLVSKDSKTLNELFSTHRKNSRLGKHLKKIIKGLSTSSSDKKMKSVFNLFSGSLLYRTEQEETSKSTAKTHGILCALQTALEARYAYAAHHSECVRLLSVKLGKQLKLDKTDLETIASAALMSYVGMISMHDSILKTPIRLTEEQNDIFRDYITASVRLLEQSGLQEHSIVDIVLHHRENYDGTGYPDGLSGEEIPFGSRLVRIVDDFDLISEPKKTGDLYIKHFGRVTNTPSNRGNNDAAIEYIAKNKGILYDPGIADKFIELYQKELRVIVEEQLKNN